MQHKMTSNRRENSEYTKSKRANWVALAALLVASLSIGCREGLFRFRYTGELQFEDRGFRSPSPRFQLRIKPLVLSESTTVGYELGTLPKAKFHLELRVLKDGVRLSDNELLNLRESGALGQTIVTTRVLCGTAPPVEFTGALKGQWGSGSWFEAGKTYGYLACGELQDLRLQTNCRFEMTTNTTTPLPEFALEPVLVGGGRDSM